MRYIVHRGIVRTVIDQRASSTGEILCARLDLAAPARRWMGEGADARPSLDGAELQRRERQRRERIQPPLLVNESRLVVDPGRA